MKISHQKQERLPQAPRAPLPELAEFLAPLRVHFAQGLSAEPLGQYLRGLLSEHATRHCDTLAEIVSQTTEHQFQHLLTDRVWDETNLNRQRTARMRILPSAGDGVLNVDETGFEKQGRHSGGVAPQYTGTAGKLTNCQGTVNCHYAERTRAWPVATSLYLPREGAEEATRRKQAPVPTASAFRTKAESARALLDEAQACGVRPACVPWDADYGDKPNCLTGLEERGEPHGGAVRANFSVTLGRGQDSPPLRADAALTAYPLQVWQTLGWSEGAKGWGRAKFLALRGWRVAGDGTRPIGWLLGPRPGRGQPGGWRYFWSDFPATPPDRAGRVCPASPGGGAVSCGSENGVGLGAVSGAALGGGSAARPHGDVELEVAGLVGRAGAGAATRERPAAVRFFPLAWTVAASLSRRSIAE